MEGKDSAIEKSSEMDEATPLVQEVKDVKGSIQKKSPLKELASELSGLSLGVDRKESPTTTEETPSDDLSDTAIQLHCCSETEEQSTASTDDCVQSETLVPAENPAEETQEEETESSDSSDVEVRNRRLWDKTMFTLLFEILLLGFPISETYYAFSYVRCCDDGDKLPLLLVLVAFVSFITLSGRILMNIAKKCGFYDEENSFPKMGILVGDFLTFLFFIVEMSYFFTIDKEKCDEYFYTYVFFVNALACGVILVMIWLDARKYIRCINILRE